MLNNTQKVGIAILACLAAVLIALLCMYPIGSTLGIIWVVGRAFTE